MKGPNIFMYMVLAMLTVFIAACSNEESEGNEAATGAEEEVQGTVTVSAAASLTDALNDIADLFNEEFPEVQVDYNFGGSGALQQQITQGAPADLFFSASESDFQAVVDDGKIDESNAVDLLENELVLIVPEGSTAVSSFDDLTNAEQIAIGTPESVPAGEYSAEAYKTMGVYDELEDKLVYAEDVRAVLNYVETENVDAGTVYITDAETSDEVEIVDTAPADSHDPIVYPLGLLNEPEEPVAAEAFYNFIQSEEALEVFEDYGFIVQ
jgi:molybdate transport system substrate-binding protein